MKIFSSKYLDELSCHAKESKRLRKHTNIHRHYDEPCQRLFNAIEPNSYIRPHRHSSPSRDELFIAVRGLFLLVTFDDLGNIVYGTKFGTEHFGSSIAVGAELDAMTWHTVICLEEGSILMEVKAGPFDPFRPKEIAPWSPDENTDAALTYVMAIRDQFV